MSSTRVKSKLSERFDCYSCCHKTEEEGDNAPCEWEEIKEDKAQVGHKFVLENYLDDDTFSVSRNLEMSHREVQFVLYCHYHLTYGPGGKEDKPLPLCVELKIKEEFPGCGSGLFVVGYHIPMNKRKGKNTNRGIDADTDTKASRKLKKQVITLHM